MHWTFTKGVVLGAIVSTLTLASSIALAGTGIGGIFNLGQTNMVNAPSKLTGAATGGQLQVTNTNSAAGSSALGLSVAPGKSPLTVNSSTQVAKLNSTYLQGRTPSSFLPAGGTAVNAAKLGGISPTGFVQGNGTSVSASGSAATGGSVLLALAPFLGTIWGYCGSNGYAGAAIELHSNTTISVPISETDWSSGDGQNSSVGGTGGDIYRLIPDTGVANIGISQFGFGNQATSIMSSADNGSASGSNTCGFRVQATTGSF